MQQARLFTKKVCSVHKAVGFKLIEQHLSVLLGPRHWGFIWLVLAGIVGLSVFSNPESFLLLISMSKSNRLQSQISPLRQCWLCLLFAITRFS